MKSLSTVFSISLGILVCILTTVFMVGLLVIGDDPQAPKSSSPTILETRESDDDCRNAFIEMNAEFVNASNVLRDLGIQVEMTLVNVGTAPNSGDGDLIWVAVRKVATNVSVLVKALPHPKP